MPEPIYITKSEGRWKATSLRVLMDGLGEGTYAVTVEQEKRKRSNQQNRYYWGVVVEVIRQGLSKEWGERITKQSTHDILRLKFLSKDKNISAEEVVTVLTSTTELDTIDMVEYVEKCRVFAEEYLGARVPLPDEQGELYA